jgi:hypothetical protein
MLDQGRQLVDHAFRLGERPILRSAPCFKPGAPACLTLVLKVDDGHGFPLAPGRRAFSPRMAMHASEGV